MKIGCSEAESEIVARLQNIWSAGSTVSGNYTGKTSLPGNVSEKTILPGNLIKGSRKRKNIPLGRNFELSKIIIDQELKPQFAEIKLNSRFACFVNVEFFPIQHNE